MLYKHILKSGSFFIIDEEDKFLLNKYIVNIMKSRYTSYVCCRYKDTRKYAGLLHRIVLNAHVDVIIDHENGNGLHCNKDNLRISDYSRNQQNRRLTKIENEVKGLQYRYDRGCCRAYIDINNKRIHLGSFVDKEDAIVARLNAEEKYHPDRGDGTSQWT